MKKHFLTLSLIGLLAACGGGTNSNNTPTDNASQAATNTPQLLKRLLSNLPNTPIGKLIKVLVV